MVENRDEYSGKEKDEGVVCPEAEEITKTEGSLAHAYMDNEAA
jgi:hypothetical protein